MADARKPRRRTRRDLDALADGVPDGTALGEFVSEMRSLGAEGVEPNQALTEFVRAPRRETDLVVAAATSPKERLPMIAQLSALAATTIGKVALTGSVAAAAVGGAVVVNEIQEPAPAEVIAAAENDSSTTMAPSTTTTAPLSTSSTSTSTTSSTSTSSTTPADAVATAAGSSTHDVLDAGTVTISVDGQLVSVVSADPNSGWSAEIEADELGEAEVNFRNGDARVDFRAEIEDGHLRIRVRDRRTDTETETFPFGSDSDDDDDVDDDDESDSDDDDRDDDDIDDDDDDDSADD